MDRSNTNVMARPKAVKNSRGVYDIHEPGTLGLLVGLMLICVLSLLG